MRRLHTQERTEDKGKHRDAQGHQESGFLQMLTQQRMPNPSQPATETPIY